MRVAERLILAVWVIVAASGVLAGAPKHPLKGQTLDFIAADTGDDTATTPLTIASAEISNPYGGPNSRGEADMESDPGRDIITFVRASGKRLAAADVLPDAGAQGAAPAPKYAFTLSFKEHVIYRMGDNVGPSLAAGFTLGLAAPSTFPVTYVTDITLDVARTDGAKASYACSGRFKGAAPRRYGPAPEIWAAMRGSSREECLTDLLAKMKSDRAFFRPGASPGA
jgi:hypothetical protein